MNRGSLRHEPDRRGHRRSFNEAPIHESGKCSIFSPAMVAISASMRPRFMNRGSYGDDWDHLGWRRASMRPRFMNRGSSARFERHLAGALGFNEAPIHESGKSVGTRVSGRPATAASMRPRFMNRGSRER